MTVATANISNRSRTNIYTVPASMRLSGSLLVYARGSASFRVAISPSPEAGYTSTADEALKEDNPNTLEEFSFAWKEAASPATNSSYMGSCVRLSRDGQRVIIGAPYQGSPYTNGGLVQVFERQSNGEWSAIYSQIGNTNHMYFGSHAAISKDGTYIAYTTAASQQVQIYKFDGSTYVLQHSFAIRGTYSGNGESSSCLSFSDDGDMLAAGDYSAANANVFIYTRSGETWSLEATIPQVAVSVNEQFGSSVCLAADGSRLIVGARYHSVTVSNAGRAYVYSRSGTSWTLEHTFDPPTPTNGHQFGNSVSLDGTGERVVIGEHLNDDGGSNRGKVYIYSRSGTTWSLEQSISGTINSAEFGRSVSINPDGSILAIGAPAETSGSGATYIYSRSGTTWSELTSHKATGTGYSGGNFGASVSIQTPDFTLPSAYTGLGGSYSPPDLTVYSLAIGAPLVTSVAVGANAGGFASVSVVPDLAAEFRSKNAVVESSITAALSAQDDNLIYRSKLSEGQTSERTALVLDAGDSIVLISDSDAPINVQVHGFVEQP